MVNCFNKLSRYVWILKFCKTFGLPGNDSSNKSDFNGSSGGKRGANVTKGLKGGNVLFEELCHWNWNELFWFDGCCCCCWDELFDDDDDEEDVLFELLCHWNWNELFGLFDGFCGCCCCCWEGFGGNVEGFKEENGENVIGLNAGKGANVGKPWKLNRLLFKVWSFLASENNKSNKVCCWHEIKPIVERNIIAK